MSAPPKPRSRRARIVRGLFVALLGLVALLGIGLAIVHEPRPETGRTGEAADALARRIEAAVDVRAWEHTGAVRWTFAGQNRHLWDRERGFDRVEWGENVVLLRVDERTGRAYVSGREVEGAEADALIEDAYARFINDSFWLNPLAKLRDDGVTLSVVDVDGGEEALLVSYASGGLTPGDAYLFRVGEDGTPTAWRLWVSVIPIGGLEIGWDGWITLATGARVSTRHPAILGLALEMTDVRGEARLNDLIEGPDPFDPLGGGED
ncbi:MAG: hypothetical protein AB7S26_31860 [Sandaracinaceae bacterium]